MEIMTWKQRWCHRASPALLIEFKHWLELNSTVQKTEIFILTNQTHWTWFSRETAVFESNVLHNRTKNNSLLAIIMQVEMMRYLLMWIYFDLNTPLVAFILAGAFDTCVSIAIRYVVLVLKSDFQTQLLSNGKMICAIRLGFCLK